MAELEIYERQAEEVVIADLFGKLCIGEGVISLRSFIRRLLGEGKNKIILNLRDVSKIDPSGIYEFSTIKKRVDGEGGIIVLLNPNVEAFDLPSILKISSNFTIYDSEGEALKKIL